MVGMRASFCHAGAERLSDRAAPEQDIQPPVDLHG
jgi:hypothetical protein